jgi:beta propeller repeat protein
VLFIRTTEGLDWPSGQLGGQVNRFAECAIGPLTVASLAALALVLCSCGTPGHKAGQPTIHESTLSHEAQANSPDISGETVVWMARPHGGWNIYGYHLSSNREFPVCTLPGDQVMPAVSGNVVVWVDGWTGGSNPTGTIWGKRLSTGAMGRISTVEGYQIYPSISGNIVVWQEKVLPSDMSQVFGTHLGKGGSFLIPLAGTDMEWPVVAGNLVVYGLYMEYGPSGETHVYSSDLTELQKTQDPNWSRLSVRVASKRSGNQGYPRTDGRTIVWSDDSADGGNIHGCSVADYREFDICVAPGGQQVPAVDGDLVVWQDKRNGNWDIYGYSLSRHIEFPICLASGDQTVPRVSGDTVVWADSRDGGTIGAATVEWPK